MVHRKGSYREADVSFGLFAKTFGNIKRRRCCGTRAKASWGMSNIVAQQGKSPFKDETIDDRRCRRRRWLWDF
jgi:hypothetical protein